MDIEMTTFWNIGDRYPKKQGLSYKYLEHQFMHAPPVCKKEVDKLVRTFSMNEYQKNKTREKENIISMTGAVFDFDNKDETFSKIDEIVEPLEQKSIFFWWYTTGSHTNEKPRWRLVIPFSRKVPIEKWEDAYEAVLGFIGNPIGIDPASKRSSQIWRFPYLPENKLFQANINSGNLLDLNKIPVSDFNEKRKIISKRYPVNKDVKESIIKALDHIPPDCPYEEWIKIGMSLQSELGDEGFPIWNSWSSYGKTYPSGREKELLRHWKSFKKQGINIGTLFHIARENGFNYQELSTNNLRKLNTIIPLEEYVENTIEDEFLDWNKFSQVDIFDLKEFPFLNPIYETFKYNSPKFNPTLFLGATISLSGFLLTNYYNCEESFTFYNMLLALPGVGKGRIIKIVKELLTHFQLEKFITRQIGTIQGLQKEFEATNGKVYIINDEISLFFRNLKNKNVNPNKQELIGAYKELYGGHSYDEISIKGSIKKKYEKTFISLLFLGNPSVFSELTSFDFNEGLLSRFLIFYEKTESLGLTPTQRTQLLKNPIKILPLPYTLPKKEIILNEECANYIELFRQCCEKKYKDIIDENEKRYLLSRAPEAVYKLSSLTINEQNEVTLDGVKWAISTVISSINSTISLMNEHFGKNIFIKDKNKVLGLIKTLYIKQKAKRLKLLRRDVIRHSHMPLKSIDEVLNYLETVGDITITKVQNKNDTISHIIDYCSKK